jgi:hypothetical protein
MSSNTESPNDSKENLRYSACTKKALTRIAKDIGIKRASSLSKAQLIIAINNHGATEPKLVTSDLLPAMRPFLDTLNSRKWFTNNSYEEQDLLKEKILELFGSSLSRLPYLASKTSPDTREWLAVQTISMNLELLHDLLGTCPICKPGAKLRYDPILHEGPSIMEAGEECSAVSTGIMRGNQMLVKAIVVRSREE